MKVLIYKLLCLLLTVNSLMDGGVMRTHEEVYYISSVLLGEGSSIAMDEPICLCLPVKGISEKGRHVNPLPDASSVLNSSRSVLPNALKIDFYRELIGHSEYFQIDDSLLKTFLRKLIFPFHSFL